MAEGRLESSYTATVEDVLVRRYVYAYSDARGERRTCTGTDVRLLVFGIPVAAGAVAVLLAVVLAVV
ncbi:hypothetical protein ABT167_13565 [Streptomyces sp. NPDC001792]|uniref:hypothetical protein n=1 Tax=Streptomyces sp. NPDC001792 TaxID=3154524 RepID=UPI0033279124